MKNFLVILSLLTIEIFSFSNIYSQEGNKNNEIVNTPYFSLQPLDNWIYKIYSNTATADFLGYGPLNAIDLVPIEVEEDENNKTSLLADFKQNEEYIPKKTPFSDYEKYLIKEFSDPIYWENITKDTNNIIDGEKALRILGYLNSTGTDIFKGYKFVLYGTLHNDNAYLFSLFGDSVSFNKYFNEFEGMVKTIKWVD